MQVSSEGHLSEVIKSANAPIRICGGGTRQIGGGKGNSVFVSGLAGVSLYEPGALTLVARSGTTLADVETLLAGEGQRLAFEVPDLRAVLGRDGASTLGGVVASNASGPRRVAVGACRDFLLGVRFVDGEGRVVSNGGRVMKNVTGYDLVKLMAGSWGRLGVLTEVAFKVLPAPEAVATLRLDGLGDAEAVEAMSRALGSPFEVSGAAHWPGQGTFLRVEGFEGSVVYRLGRLQEMLGGDSCDAPWNEIRDLRPFVGREGDIWRLSVKPSDAPGLVARAGAEAVLYDWGGGLVWLLTEPGIDLRARLGSFMGHATLFRGKGRVFHPEPPGVAAITAGLRAKFDPRRIFATPEEV